MLDYSDAGFFVLRTPLLPFGEFLKLLPSSRVQSALGGSDDCMVEEAIAADRLAVRRELRLLVKRPELRSALWLGSPDFFDSLAFWNDPVTDRGERIEQSLYRYVARSASRSTPFGLFAGCTTGRVSDHLSLRLAPRTEYKRNSRLDMKYLWDLVEMLASDTGVQMLVRFVPNSSLYRVGERYHHAQGFDENDQRVYRLIATEPTDYLDAMLQRSSAGATAEELAASLIQDDAEITLEEAQEYVRQLIATQILVPELLPAVTGMDPLQEMIGKLRISQLDHLAESLSGIWIELRAMDQAGITADVASYSSMLETAGRIGAPFNRQHLVQVDMTKPGLDVSLTPRLLKDILRGVETLHSVTGAADPKSITEFKDAFRQRYEDRDVRLVDALDEESGIGFERQDGPAQMAEPLLQGINFPSASHTGRLEMDANELVLLHVVEELRAQGESNLVLTPEVIQRLAPKSSLPLPDSFSVLGSLGRMRSEDKYVFSLHSISGPSAGNLMSRFCHADPDLDDQVRRLAQLEEAYAGTQAVLAEITHLPEGRIGNVVYRPILRTYEIPFLASAGVGQEQRLPIDDLMVSVRNDRVVVRSQRLGREIIPRLTTAHAYFNDSSLKLYKFLCTLQSQGSVSGLSWNWGVLKRGFVSLPRVSVGNVVLSEARWMLSQEDIQALSLARGVQRFRKLDKLRQARGLPRFLFVEERDNRLLIDFENALSVETFVEYIGKRETVELVEFFPAPDDLFAEGPEGVFAHEIVVPFCRNRKEADPGITREKPQADLVTVPEVNGRNTFVPSISMVSELRTFFPGSEWVYAKVYGGPFQLDRLLTSAIHPMVEELQASGKIDRWFFIRYADPDWHLRLRFHGHPEDLMVSVLPRIFERLHRVQQEGMVWKIQLDTYEREVERYGGFAGVEVAEQLFHADSDLVIRILSQATEGLLTEPRWKLAVLSIDFLLTHLGFDTAQKKNIAESLRRSYEQGLEVNPRYIKQLSERFRQERRGLEQLLQGGGPTSAIAGLRRELAGQFSERLHRLAGEINSLENRNELSHGKLVLAHSYVHMHLNRLLRSAHNAQETILYDFLVRLYGSMVAGRPNNTSN